MPNWEKFTMTGGRGVYEMRVSLSPRGVFTLNQPTYDEMGKPEAVEFLYDRTERLIGLRPATKEIPHAYIIRKQKTNKSYLIGARPFCFHYKLNVENTVRFKEIKFTDGVLILDLKNTMVLEKRKVAKSDKNLHGNDNYTVD